MPLVCEVAWVTHCEPSISMQPAMSTSFAGILRPVIPLTPIVYGLLRPLSLSFAVCRQAHASRDTCPICNCCVSLQMDMSSVSSGSHIR